MLDGQERRFCCPGCQAVAQAIDATGLMDFYRYTDRRNKPPETLAQALADPRGFMTGGDSEPVCPRRNRAPRSAALILEASFAPPCG
ncbi:MAG: heavy metal translocating P-type ATPase metal-binding domain-containing protein [Candidatus Competibacteraceae bacterium]